MEENSVSWNEVISRACSYHRALVKIRDIIINEDENPIAKYCDIVGVMVDVDLGPVDKQAQK